MKHLVSFLLSFTFSTWMYSETILIVPEVEPLARDVVQTLTIPTHDKWTFVQDPEKPKKTIIKQAKRDLSLSEDEIAYLKSHTKQTMATDKSLTKTQLDQFQHLDLERIY